MVEGSQEMSPEEINDMLRKELRMTGVVNSREDIIDKLDKTLVTKSEVIPVERKKDGSFSARSGIMTGEELQLVSDYVNHKIRTLGTEILAGQKEVNPYEEGKKNACEYCAYKKVCGFDTSLPGYEKRKLESLDTEVIKAKMKEELQ